MSNLQDADGGPAGHIAEDDLRHYIRGLLNGARVSLFEDHAIECAQCQERIREAAHLAAQLSVPGDRQRPYVAEEKRLGQRFHVTGIGSLHVLAPLERDRSIVWIVDVSVNGVGLRLKRMLEAGALVHVHFGRVLVLGEVRHCRLVQGEFQAGILVTNVTELKT